MRVRDEGAWRVVDGAIWQNEFVANTLGELVYWVHGNDSPDIYLFDSRRKNMRRIALSFVICGSLVVLTTQALSQPSHQTDPRQKQARPSPPVPARQTSPQSPVAVAPAAKTEKELADERQDREEKSKLDRRLVDLTAELSDYTGGLFRATVALAIATFLLVAATFGLLLFAYRQWGDVRDSLAIAKQSAKAAESSAETANIALRTTQRAYISVEPSGIRPFRRKREGAPVGAPEPLLAHLSIRNVGHLPAREVSWSVHVHCDARNDWHEFTDNAHLRTFPGKMVITPGTEVRRGTKQFSNTMLTRPANAEGWYCYVWGRVHYKDGFDVQRSTDFCHRYNSDAVRDGNEIPAEHARYHIYGNEGT